MRLARRPVTRGAAALLLVAAATAAGCRNRRPADGRAEVRGRVVSANGRPLPDARLTLEREIPRGAVPVSRGEPAGDGLFAFRDLPPGRYVLRARAQGYAHAAVPLELAPGDAPSTVLRLEPEQLLEGTVLDTAGKPLPDVVVLVWPTGSKRGAPTTTETRTAVDGRFTLAGLPRGSWTVLAEASGFGPLQLERVDVPTRPLVLRLEGQGRAVGGMVVGPDGEGRAGARVLLGGASLRTPRTATTEKRGTYLFSGVGHGRYALRATLDRLASPPVLVTLDEGTGWVPPVRLDLQPGAFVQGRVTDQAGRPLPGATVDLVALPQDELPEVTRADREGEFAFGPIPAGKYRVQASAPDHVHLEPLEVRLRAEGTPTLALKLARAARLVGRVLDERGRPLPGVSVSAVGIVAGQDQLAVLPGALPLASEAAELPAPSLARRGRLRTATTDGDGRFRLEELAPGRTRLELTHPDTLPLRREPILLGPGDLQDLRDLTLQAGVLLGGRVLGEDGRPVDGARVEARPTGKRPGAPIRVSADRDGRFGLRVPAGDYAIVAVAPERAPQSIFSFHADPAAATPLEFRLPRADGVLEGKLTDVGGRGIGRATVIALAPPGGPLPAPATPVRPRPASEVGKPNSALTLGTVNTDGGGRFRMTGLPRGALVIEVRHPDWPPIAQVVTVGDKLALAIARPGGIEGEVRERGSGVFVARYELEAIGPDGRTPDRQQQQGAGFQLMNLLPGKWTLRIRSPGFAPAEQVVEVPPGESKKEPSLRGVRVELSRGGAVATP